MKTVFRSLGLAAAISLSLVACNQTMPTAPSSASVTPSGFRMPEGSGCKGEVDRYRAVMDNDLAMGHVNQSVYTRVVREIDQAASACAAGRDAEAVRMINTTKSRFGYA
jgi:predicted small lipoprotein YifL